MQPLFLPAPRGLSLVTHVPLSLSLPLPRPSTPRCPRYPPRRSGRPSNGPQAANIALHSDMQARPRKRHRVRPLGAEKTQTPRSTTTPEPNRPLIVLFGAACLSAVPSVLKHCFPSILASRLVYRVESALRDTRSPSPGGGETSTNTVCLLVVIPHDLPRACLDACHPDSCSARHLGPWTLHDQGNGRRWTCARPST